MRTESEDILTHGIITGDDIWYHLESDVLALINIFIIIILY